MQREGDSQRQLKMFVESLLADLDSMQHEIRDTCASKNSLVRQTKSIPCQREGYPVNITKVTKLGLSSLYVRWDIIDRKSIKGYEIYLDGYLSNRYHSAQHEAAVICEVDINQSHKVALMALSEDNDSNYDVICSNIERCAIKSCRRDGYKPYGTSELWIPSIYVYKPHQNKTE